MLHPLCFYNKAICSWQKDILHKPNWTNIEVSTALKSLWLHIDKIPLSFSPPYVDTQISMNSIHTTTDNCSVWVGLVWDTKRTMCVWSEPQDSFLLIFSPEVKGCSGVQNSVQDIKSAFKQQEHVNEIHADEMVQTAKPHYHIQDPSPITWWNVQKMMMIDSENIWQSYLWQAACVDPQPCDLAEKLLVHLFFFAHSVPQSVSQTFPENSQTLHQFPPPLPSSSCWSLSLSDGFRLRGCSVYNARVGLWHTANCFTACFVLFSPRAGAEIVRLQNSSNMVFWLCQTNCWS